MSADRLTPNILEFDPETIKRGIVASGLTKDSLPLPDLTNRRQLIEYLYEFLQKEDRLDQKTGSIPTNAVRDEHNLFTSEAVLLSQQNHMCSEYMNVVDSDSVLLSALLSIAVHRNQYRRTGDPFPTHPLGVANEIVFYYKPSANYVITANLHDTYEDTALSKELVTTLFGNEVHRNIDDLSKLKGENVRPELADNLTRLKTINALAERPGVPVIKIYDRLFNMRTLYGTPDPLKRKRTINETENIYIPLAEVLGLHREAEELRQLCLYYRDPEAFTEINAKLLSCNQQIREVSGESDVNKQLDYFRVQIEELFKKSGYSNLTISVEPPSYKDVYDFGEFVLKVNIAMDGYSETNPNEWGKMGLELHNLLYWNSNLKAVAIDQEKIKKETTNRLTDSITFRSQFSNSKKNQLPVEIRISPKDAYIFETEGNVGFIHSEGIPDGIADMADLARKKTLAVIKYGRLKQRLGSRTTPRNSSNLQAEWRLRELSPRIPPNHILVIGEDKKGNRQPWPIPEKLATVIGFASSISPKGWRRAGDATVNGKPSSLTDPIEPGDIVYIRFGSKEVIDPRWLHRLPSESDNWDQLQHDIDQNLNSGNEKVFKEMELNILKTAHWRLEIELPATEWPLMVGTRKIIDTIRKLTGNGNINEYEFMMKLGRAQIPDSVIHHIIPLLSEINKKVGVIEISFKPNAPNQQSTVTGVLAKAGFNLPGAISYALGDSASLLKLYIDPDDVENIPLVIKTLKNCKECKDVGLVSVNVVSRKS